MAYSIDIKDGVTGVVSRYQESLRSGRLNPVMGRAVVKQLQNNFRKLNGSRANQMGGARTNFYEHAAKSTQFLATVDEIRVSVNQVGVRQRLEGGLIRPVKGKYLTIPAVSEAYGKRAREFPNLRLAFGRGHKVIGLEEAPATIVGRGKKGYRAAGSQGGRIIFWLVKSALQKADPSVVPSDGELTATALQAAGSALERLAKRQ